MAISAFGRPDNSVHMRTTTHISNYLNTLESGISIQLVSAKFTTWKAL